MIVIKSYGNHDGTALLSVTEFVRLYVLPNPAAQNHKHHGRNHGTFVKGIS